MREKAPTHALAGYMQPKPVVWASVFPESQDDFTLLRQALDRLRLSDSALSYEEESSGVLGRGFRCGFLGMLHLEIITERLQAAIRGGDRLIQIASRGHHASRWRHRLPRVLRQPEA